MSQADSVLDALRRKRNIARELVKFVADLPRADAREALGEALLILDEPEPTKATAVVVPQGHVWVPTVLASPSSDTSVQHKVQGRVGTGRGNRTREVLAALAKKPRVPIRVLAMDVMGTDGREAQNHVRSLLSNLNKRGLVRRVGVGEWEVIST